MTEVYPREGAVSVNNISGRLNRTITDLEPSLNTTLSWLLSKCSQDALPHREKCMWNAAHYIIHKKVVSWYSALKQWFVFNVQGWDSSAIFFGGILTFRLWKTVFFFSVLTFLKSPTLANWVVNLSFSNIKIDNKFKNSRYLPDLVWPRSGSEVLSFISEYTLSYNHWKHDA